MPTKTATPVEFASDAWFSLAEAVLTELAKVNREQLQGLQFSLCEVYKNVPAHLPSSNGTIAWTFTIDGGEIEIRRHERKDVDFWVTWDYEAILPIAKMVYSADAAVLAEAESIRAAAEHAGKRQSAGSVEHAPAPIKDVLYQMHNRLAELTA